MTDDKIKALLELADDVDPIDDRKALVSDLAALVRELTSRPPHDVQEMTIRDLRKRLADLTEWRPWTPGAAAPPRDGTRVLILFQGRGCVAWWDDARDGWAWGGNALIGVQPDYWLPLPEAPK